MRKTPIPPDVPICELCKRPIWLEGDRATYSLGGHMHSVDYMNRIHDRMRALGFEWRCFTSSYAAFLVSSDVRTIRVCIDLWTPTWVDCVRDADALHRAARDPELQKALLAANLLRQRSIDLALE